MDKIEEKKYWYSIARFNDRMTDFVGVQETLCKGKEKPEFFINRFTGNDCKARPWNNKWSEMKGRNPVYLPSFEDLQEITLQELIDLRDFGFFFDEKMNKFNKSL